MRSIEIEADVQQARRQIYEETKDMSNEERAAYMNKRGKEAAEKYGFKIADTAEVALLRRA